MSVAFDLGTIRRRLEHGETGRIGRVIHRDGVLCRECGALYQPLHATAPHEGCEPDRRRGWDAPPAWADVDAVEPEAAYSSVVDWLRSEWLVEQWPHEDPRGGVKCLHAPDYNALWTAAPEDFADAEAWFLVAAAFPRIWWLMASSPRTNRYVAR